MVSVQDKVDSIAQFYRGALYARLRAENIGEEAVIEFRIMQEDSGVFNDVDAVDGPVDRFTILTVANPEDRNLKLERVIGVAMADVSMGFKASLIQEFMYENDQVGEENAISENARVYVLSRQ